MLTEEVKAEKAIFAGGCFWCIEAAFENLPGVISAVSGYCGGSEKNPTYAEVSSGTTDQIESVLVMYDPKVVSYQQLVEEFWKNIDPTQAGGQFADIGPQYRTVIFYSNDAQKKIAEDSKKKLQASLKFQKPIVTEILKATEFYEAEEYNQDYHVKERTHYNMYKEGSGRAGFIRRNWKK